MYLGSILYKVIQEGLGYRKIKEVENIEWKAKRALARILENLDQCAGEKRRTKKLEKE